MAFPFEVSRYQQRPLLGAEATSALAQSLLAHKPATLHAAGVTAVGRLETALGTFRKDWADNAASATSGNPDAVIADRGYDQSWRGFHRRVESWTYLEGAAGEEPERAARHLDTYFPDGLVFLSWPYEEEWAHGDQLLRRMTESGDLEDLKHLAGERFVAAVQTAHGEYSRKLAKSGPAEVRGRKVDLRDSLRALHEAISGYALQVLATVDETKPETIEAARTALKPLDDERAARLHRRSKKLGA